MFGGVFWDLGFRGWLSEEGFVVWKREVCFCIDHWAAADGNLSLSSPLSLLRTMALCHCATGTVDHNPLCES